MNLTHYFSKAQSYGQNIKSQDVRINYNESRSTPEADQPVHGQSIKGTFLSQSTDVFVITPNRQTFFFPETENLKFSDLIALAIQPNVAFLPLQASKLSNFQISSISKQFSVTKIQIFCFRETNVCMFGVMTKTSASSNKKVPLRTPWLIHD